MKYFVMAVVLATGLTAFINRIGMTRSASAYQRGGQPLFLDYNAEFDLEPTPNTAVTFQNPVRIKNINYPWVQVEPVGGPLTRQGPEIWVNMDFISVVRKRR